MAAGGSDGEAGPEVPDAPSREDLAEVARLAGRGGTRVRLSCVLLDDLVGSLDAIRDCLAFAASVGVDNVVFRQLMLAPPPVEDPVAAWSDRHRVELAPLLEQISAHREFRFVNQVVGYYYYYFEVWRYRGVDVVFEAADLDQLERTKRTLPGVIHELVFHPDARLSSTWQPEPLPAAKSSVQGNANIERNACHS